MSAQRARPAAGETETLSGEMETLRGVLHQRLAAAVDDILGEFGRTVARYRDQIDLQRRQLDGLKAEERARSRSAERLQDWEIKSEPNGAADPAESSDTEDSGDDCRATGPLEAEAAGGGAGRAAPPGPFGCGVCGESFPSRRFLLAHGAAPPTACGLWGERPEKPRRRLRGQEEAPFRCGVCGRSFTLRGNLRTHARIHSGERPHGCTVCGKSFGRRATLVRHVRSHTGEKPFACAHCGRGFVEKGNLTVHLRTHAGIQGPHAGTLGTHAGTPGTHAGTLGTHAGTLGTHAGTLGTHAGIQGPHGGTLGPHIDLSHAVDVDVVIRPPPDAHWTCLK